MNLQLKRGAIEGRPAQPGHARPDIVTHGRGPTNDDGDPGVARGGLAGEQALDIQTLADDNVLLEHGVNIAQRDGLQLVYERFGAGVDAPRQLDVAVACVCPRQQARDADAAADEDQAVALQQGGARVLWVRPVHQREEVAVALQQPRQPLVLLDYQCDAS